MKSDLSETCYLFFSTLANPTRLAILELLRSGPKNVTAIAEELKLEQSSVSHSLKKLENCNFVFAKRKIKERIYTLNKETMEPVFKTFDFHARKYCPAKGRCLRDAGLREHRKKNASNKAYVTHE
jgi:DNA-binding transcriptional ArsR family regulator